MSERVESIAIHRVDNWGVIYVNGKELDQEHDVSDLLTELLDRVCQENGIEIEEEYHEDDEVAQRVENHGRFPSTLAKLRKIADEE